MYWELVEGFWHTKAEEKIKRMMYSLDQENLLLGPRLYVIRAWKGNEREDKDGRDTRK